MKTIVTLIKLWHAKRELDAARARAQKECIEAAKKAVMDMGLVAS